MKYTVNQQITEAGQTHSAGEVIELTAERAKQLGDTVSPVERKLKPKNKTIKTEDVKKKRK